MILFYIISSQVFTKKGLKQVKYEKYKSISFLYPIDYQYKKRIEYQLNLHNQGS
jgi:hypothetical protein